MRGISRIFWLLGSPPRRRGKALAVGVHRGGNGITPAWAGKRALRGKGAAPL